MGEREGAETTQPLSVDTVDAGARPKCACTFTMSTEATLAHQHPPEAGDYFRPQVAGIEYLHPFGTRDTSVAHLARPHRRRSTRRPSAPNMLHNWSTFVYQPFTYSLNRRRCGCLAPFYTCVTHTSTPPSSEVAEEGREGDREQDEDERHSRQVRRLGCPLRRLGQ